MSTTTTTRVQLFDALYEACQENTDILADVLDRYVSSLSDHECLELEDCIVNNWGED